MTTYSPKFERLIESLRRLPGVGPKSAQRMALHLLDRDQEGGKFIAKSLGEAIDGITRCPRTRMFCEPHFCGLCKESRNESGQLCIVETPADLLAVEQGTAYRGRYFLLMGKLSPIDGVGPEQLGFPALRDLLSESWINEVILAINPTVEGEATAHFISEMARAANVIVSRIAQGVPMGGELEYVDGGTLVQAFKGRTSL